MTSWHDSNKDDSAVDLDTMVRDMSAPKQDKEEKFKKNIDETLDKAGALLLDAIASSGGEIQKHSDTLFDVWERVGRSFSEQAVSISAIKIANKATDKLLESDAPAEALAMLALAFRSASVRLVEKAQELSPELKEEMSKAKEESDS